MTVLRVGARGVYGDRRNTDQAIHWQRAFTGSLTSLLRASPGDAGYVTIVSTGAIETHDLTFTMVESFPTKTTGPRKRK